LISKKLFIKEFLIYGIGGGIGRFFGLILVPLFTRALDRSHYGILDITLVLLIMISLLLGLQTESGMIRHFYEAKEEERHKELVSTAFWTWTCLAVLGSLVLFIFSSYWALLIYGEFKSEGLLWVNLLALNVFFHIEFHQLIHVIRLQHRALLYTSLNGLPLLLFGIFSVLALCGEMGVSGILFSLALANAIGFCVLLYFTKNMLAFSFSKLYFKKILHYSLPLTPAVILNWGQRHAIRIVMLGFFSMAAIGIFSVADKMAMIVALVNRAFSQAWGPHAVKIMNKEGSLKTYARFFNIYMSVTIVGILLLLLLNPLIIRLLSPKEYWTAENISGWLICGMAILGLNSFSALGNSISKKTYLNLPGFACSAIICVGGSALVLLFYHSLNIVAVMFFLGMLVGNIVLLGTSQMAVRIPYKMRNYGLGFLIFSILGIVSSFSYKYLSIIAIPVALLIYFILDNEDKIKLKNFMILFLRKIPFNHSKIR